jgi:N-terminal domain of galactosyltransferase
MKDASFLITYRESGSPDRRENLFAVSRWLGQWPELQVIVVEQDTVSRLDALPFGTAYIAYNAGPFNKGWGFNIAARLARNPILIVGDADVIAPQTLADGVERCRQGAVAVKPYREIVDLTPEETGRVRGGEWAFSPTRPKDSPRSREGQHEFVVFAGGLFVIRRDAYLRIGGFDERFLGWGGEDDAMSARIRRMGIPTEEIVTQPALHLWHPRSHESTFGQAHYKANVALLADYDRYSAAEIARLCEVQRQAMGHLHKYRPAG